MTEVLVLVNIVFFFFKQKTAYEMRISDWSSDVCSSDLLGVLAAYIMVTVAVGPNKEGLSLPLAFSVALAATLGITLLVHIAVDHWVRPFGHFVGTVLTIAIGGIIMGVVSMVWSGQTMRLILVEGHVDRKRPSMKSSH